MATAEEILAQAAGDVTGSNVFVIDNDLRTIKVPSGVTNLGVESDDAVNRVQFKMPSTYCGIDLSTFKVQINYLNARAEEDMYEVDDLQKVDDYMTFSWLVGRHAATYKGNVKFVVCMKDVDGSGNVSREFNTTITTLPILEGLEVGEQVISEYGDILEQWRAQLFGTGDTAEAELLATAEATKQDVASYIDARQEELRNLAISERQSIEDKGSEVLATIPETYTDVSNTAQEAFDTANKVLKTKANSITNTVEGGSIRVDDAANEPICGLNIYGKSVQITTTGIQMFNKYDVTNGMLEKDGSIATDATYVTSGFIPVLPNTTYYHTHKESVRSKFYNSSKEPLTAEWDTQNASGGYFTTPANAYYFRTTIGSAYRDSFMLHKGNAPVPYEPYTGGKPSPNPDYYQSIENDDAITVHLSGKNYVDLHAASTSLDATSTVSGDSIIVTSTSDTNLSRTTLKVNYPLNTPLTLSFDATVLECEAPNAGSTVRLRKGGNSAAIVMLDLSKIGVKQHYKITEKGINDSGYELWLYLRTLSEAVGKISIKFENIQLEASENETKYEPYREVQSTAVDYIFAGVPVPYNGNYVDDNGQEWICDEIDFERGVYIQRVKAYSFNDGVSVSFGNGIFENWYIEASQPGMDYAGALYINIPDIQPNSKALCTHYIQGENVGYEGKEGLFEIVDKQFRINAGEYSGDTDTNDWDRWIRSCYGDLEPLALQYILETPIETPISESDMARFNQMRCNQLTTFINNDADAHMSFKYIVDTKTYIDTAINKWLTEYFANQKEVSS